MWSARSSNSRPVGTMKKVILLKVDTEAASPASHSCVTALASPEPAAAIPERTVPIHPPLPVDPPLSPLKSPKKEIEEEVQNENVDEFADKSMIPIIKIKTEEPPRPEVCRDFIRGSCSRIGCKYNHNRDLTQLQGVYTFCHNFQNKVCTRPKCKYVHATIPEQETFYRTGYLPPHTLAHHNNPEPSAAPPPPPPTYCPTQNVHPNPTIIAVKNPSSLLQINNDNNKPISCNANAGMSNSLCSLPETSGGGVGPTTPKFFSTCDTDDQNKLNPCSTCPVKINRIKHATEKLNELFEMATAINRQIAHVEEKQQRLQLVEKVMSCTPADQPRMIDTNVLQMLWLLHRQS